MIISIVIPAKGTSQRLENKNLLKIEGKSLVEMACEKVLKCKNNIDIRQVGIDWAIKQTQELIEFGAPCVHFYTMGKVDNVLKIMANFK